MKIELSIKPPTPPNFVSATILDKEVTIPIGELSRAKAKEYADLVHASIIKHHKEKSKVKSTDPE